MSSSYQNHNQNQHHLVQHQVQPQQKVPLVKTRHILVDIDPHKMSLEPLNLSTSGNFMDWRGGGGQSHFQTLLGGPLHYQRSNNQQQEILGPITLSKEKETMVSYDEKDFFQNVPTKPVPVGRQPFYFMANNGAKNPTMANGIKRDTSKNKVKRNGVKGAGGDGDIASTDLMRGLPNLDAFKTLLFQQFGTPEERYTELLEQLRIMVEKVKLEVLSPEFSLKTYQVLQGAQVAEIFYWCKVLKVTTETFFRTLELFDRFTILFSDELTPTLMDLTVEQKAACMRRILFQKPLRICSCIMLASKLHSNLQYPGIGLEGVKAGLEKESNYFSIKAVAESEIRVLRVLNYRTSWVTPYDLTEQLLSLLDIPLNALPQIFTVAMLYLKYSYMRHRELYLQVKDIIQHNLGPKKFKLSVEYNTPLRAAAIVAAAAFHVNRDFQKASITKLSALISEPENRIEIISQLLLVLVKEIHPRNNIPTIVVD